MPVFFLHQQIGTDQVLDLEGAEFDNLEQARQEALVAARELLSEAVLKAGQIDLTRSFVIEDESGGRARVSFGDAVTIHIPET